MSKAWIEDLWLTEPRETLPDGSKVKIPVVFRQVGVSCLVMYFFRV